MSQSNPRTPTLLPLFTLLLTAFLGYWFVQTGASAAPAKGGKDARLNALLQERLTALREAANFTTKAYETGVETLANVMAANQAVHSAELDLCGTDKERIALLEKMISEAKNYETLAAQQVGRGIDFASSVPKAKVNRLEVEIALERLKNK
jgi:hypothetical protein